jgi:hypothetical protein
MRKPRLLLPAIVFLILCDTRRGIIHNRLFWVERV